MVEEKDFITDRLSAAASEGRGNIQVPDEVCLGKLRNIIQLVQYLPTMQNDTLSDVSKELTNLSTSHQFTDFFVVQLMLVKSSQSAIFDPKFHDNYLAFLEKVDSESLYTEIVLTTGVICKAILHPEILLHPSSGDLLLRVIKNLGGWLAKMIISTNKFLSKPDIVDLESVIVEAYQLGLMTKIIPFVLEVLEPCRTSPIYQPPNPWIMKILNLLYEIYMMPNLKNWLRLSIERLLKKIGDLEQLNATSVLLKKLRKMNNNQDFEPFVVKRFDGKATYDPPLESLGKDLFKEFSVTIKKPDLFFGDYPELVRKLEDVLLEVLGKIGPLFIRLATTLGYETVEASVLIANSYRNSRTDRIVVTPEIIVFMDKVEATKASAKKYRQDIDKTFLSGWMSYLVGDLLQQQGIPYALQPEIVESVIDENFECIREKLEICGDEEAIRYSIELAFRKPRLGENIMKEINEALEKEVDVDAMSSCLDIVLKSDEEKLAALCEAICNQFTVEHDPPSLYISRNKMAYLDPFVKRREGGQRDLLHALEAFWEKSSALRGFEDLVLNGFISTGYLSEEVIQEWYDDSSKRDENDAWYESLGSMFEVLAKQTLARLGEKLAAPVARDDLEEFIDSI